MTEILEMIRTGQLVSLSDLDLSLDDIMKMHMRPFRLCPCCKGEVWHEVTQILFGVMYITSRVKCGDCDMNGLAPYISFN